MCWKRARREAGVAAGETTADGRVSLATARCLGACGIAPAVVFDGAVAGHQSGETVAGEFRSGERMDPPELCRSARKSARGSRCTSAAVSPPAASPPVPVPCA